MRPAALAVGVPALLVGALAVPASAHDHRPPAGTITVLATGLANPRHLVPDRDGVLVATVGRGAADPAGAPCITAVNPETQQPERFCYGTTGAIVRVSSRGVRTVVGGLPSVAGESGDQAGGVADLTNPHHGWASAVVGLGGDPRDKAASQPGDAARLAGRLLSLDLRRGTWRAGSDVSAFEARNNPDSADPGSGFDSNPYGIASAGTRHDRAVVVTDAGGNDLLRVDGRRTSLLAVFHARLAPPPGAPAGAPPIPMQAVPTSVTKGPDGAYYVSELTGFPFQLGGARVWRVVPGRAPTVYASGFTNIIDLSFDRRGRLLVLEIASRSLLDPTSPGALYLVGHNGSRTLVTDKLAAPGGVTVGRDGRAYVTNLSVSATAGQVLAVTLPR